MSDAPAVSFHLGEMTYAFSQDFVLTYISGLIVILLFSLDRFGQPSFGQREEDPETIFPPKYLALRYQYVRGLVTYVIGTEVAFTVASILGPRVFTSLGWRISATQDAWPLWVALALSGVIPNVRQLNKIELIWRRRCHESAYIPDGARAIATSLTRSDFDVSMYNEPDILAQPLFKGIDQADFSAASGTNERRWLRITCVLYKLKAALQDPSDKDIFDASFVSLYRGEIEKLLARHKTLGAELARIKEKKKQNTATMPSPELDEELRKLRQRVFIFAGCAVRVRQPNEEKVYQALASIGFKLQPRQSSSLLETFFPSLALMSIIVFAVIYVAQDIMNEKSIYRGQASNTLFALQWALYTLALHGTAAIVSASLKEKVSRDGKWNGRSYQRAKLSLLAGCLGFAFLPFMQYLNGAVDQTNFWHLFVWLPLPTCTAFFTVTFLGKPPAPERRLLNFILNALTQGLGTAFAAFFIGHIWIDWADSAHQFVADDADFLKFLMLGVFTIGSSIGFLFPYHAYRAMSRPREPSAIQRQADIARKAEMVILDPRERERWLATPLRELDGESPANACRSDLLTDRTLRILARMETLRDIAA